MSAIGIACASITIGLLLPHMREHVLGQPVGFSTHAPQVMVQQQTEPPKCVVDFTMLPPQGGNPPQIRVITIVDTEAKRIAVYHLEIATGNLWLLSVRDIQPDLMLQQFNAKPPLPSEIAREIQTLLEKNK